MEYTTTEKGKKALEIIENIIPELSEHEQEKLLSFSEGMAFVKSQQKEKAPA